MSTNPSLPISRADVEAAAKAISGNIVRTPCLKSETLSAMTGAEVWLKFENLQFTAAYKERGALNKLLSLTPEERARGVIAASAGNHAQGLAYNAKRLGIPATIVMPRFTPIVKVQQTEGHGADVVLHGEKFEEAGEHALALAEKRGFVFVHPFDDPLVMAGQGTVGLEMLEAVPDLDTFIVPIGGGGLISGIATYAKAFNPKIDIIGVQAELYPSMHSLMSGKPAPCDGDTLAEGIAVKTPGMLTRQVVKALVEEILLVGERDLEHAVSLLLTIEKTVVEGAGAAGLAALLAHPRRFRGTRVGLVLCGGNIDTRLLANVLLRELARSGRLARLRIRLKDRPGQLFEVARIFDQQQVNILEVYHQRVFTSLPAKGLIAEIECETRDRDHLHRLIEALRAAAYDVQMVESG
ncbi:threonine ammonia-lyase [Polymorphobacter multimanifer]|uniref:Threonine dehydratase n=1 Tax=Polymorphobacter multimanifer TaxID=1070431 RepID=A0A841L665_9SPHN|nr:threonine ammonia-lyase [Polymorphobacter multimanifer]MBB6227736.1 threonine dehydratase [Polymorphobacter multimanifer]GGI90154.1 threonine ammonia-lyase [Polymorphobacter multimanifer]